MKNTISLKENRDFRRLYSRGKFYADKSVAIYFMYSKNNFRRLGLTVSTKIGKAVTRNAIKRKFREVYTIYEEQLPANIDMVIVARAKIHDVQFSDLKNSFEKAIINLFKKSDNTQKRKS